MADIYPTDQCPGTILLVDDDVDGLTLLSNALERQGHRTFLAPSADHALELAKDVADTLDTIVLDIMMPGEFSGYDVIEKLKSDPSTSAIPILVLSAKTSTEDIAKSYALGAFQHVCKPCDIYHLSIVIKNIVRLRQVERSAQQSAEKYQALIDYSPVQIVMLCPEIKILEMNKSFRQHYPDAEVGCEFFRVCYDEPPEPLSDHPVIRALKSGEVEQGDIIGIINGKRMFIQVRAAPIKDQTGKVTAIIDISLNVTAQRKMEESLRKQVERHNRALQLQDRTAEHLMSVQRELQQKKIELERLSITDGLTGLFNRREFDRLMDSEARRSARYHHNLSIALIDIDHFKNVNDSHGHQAGDQALIKIAEILLKSLRETDTVSRYGGEEFVVILPETDYETALRISDRLRESVEATDFEGSGQVIQITISVGVASICKQAINPARLVAEADESLYRAKDSGRNRVMGNQDPPNASDLEPLTAT